MDTRQERMVRNEAVFRRVNERLQELGESFSVVAERGSFVCECADLECATELELTLGEYEQVRSNPGWFMMAAGHERPEIETVVDRTDRFVVVRKADSALEETAIAEDPRAE